MVRNSNTTEELVDGVRPRLRDAAEIVGNANTADEKCVSSMQTGAWYRQRRCGQRGIAGTTPCATATAAQTTPPYGSSDCPTRGRQPGRGQRGRGRGRGARGRGAGVGGGCRRRIGRWRRLGRSAPRPFCALGCCGCCWRSSSCRPSGPSSRRWTRASRRTSACGAPRSWCVAPPPHSRVALRYLIKGCVGDVHRAQHSVISSYNAYWCLIDEDLAADNLRIVSDQHFLTASILSGTLPPAAPPCAHRPSAHHRAHWLRMSYICMVAARVPQDTSCTTR